VIFASLCQGKLWVSSLLTRTGAATQPGHANPTYLLNGYRRLVPGTLEIKKNKKKTTPNIGQEARASEGEDEDIAFKRFDSQRLLQTGSALSNRTEIPF